MLMTLKAILAAALMAACAAGFANDYPTKPIRIIIPYSAGGSTDVIGRTMAAEMAKSLGQNVFIENKPGASGALGIQAVAAAPADGYTLLFIPNTFTQLPQSSGKSTVDVEKDFAPITIPLSLPIVIFATPNQPYNTLPELIAYLKAHPRTAYSTSGIGSPGHVAFAVLNDYLKTDLVHIPYKGGSESTAAVMSGEVPLAVAATQPGLGWVEQGRLKMLGVTGSKRSKLIPQVPALGELNIPLVENKVWLGFFAPRGTPNDVVLRLHKAITAAVQSEEVISKAKSAAIEVEVPNSPAEFSSLISKEVKMWGDLYRRFPLQ